MKGLEKVVFLSHWKQSRQDSLGGHAEVRGTSWARRGLSRGPLSTWNHPLPLSPKQLQVGFHISLSFLVTLVTNSLNSKSSPPAPAPSHVSGELPPWHVTPRFRFSLHPGAGSQTLLCSPPAS